MSSSETLVIISDSKLSFNIHVDNKIKKCHKMIDLIKRLSVSASKKSLLRKNPLSGHIWTMEISHTINQKIKVFITN